MKIEVDIGTDDIRFEIRQSILKLCKPYYIKPQVDNLVSEALTVEVKKLLKDIGLKKLIKEGVIEYLERYKVRDVIKELKMKDLVKK